VSVVRRSGYACEISWKISLMISKISRLGLHDAVPRGS
jgi:hypothetical protein